MGDFPGGRVDDHRTDHTGHAECSESPAGAIGKFDRLAPTKEDAPPAGAPKPGEDLTI